MNWLDVKQTYLLFRQGGTSWQRFPLCIHAKQRLYNDRLLLSM